MLPTFLIGLREGVEAALIVCIIAAFLVNQGRRDLLKWVWIGVGTATAISVTAGVFLQLLGETLPDRPQLLLQAAVAAIAVVFVSYMIVWMRSHAREIKGKLEANVGAAVATGSIAALATMSFFAVLREGFETAFFMLAILQQTNDPAEAIWGAVLGITVALVLGVLFYRGGTRINMAKFFRLTSVVLAVVAAGLLASAFRAALSAGLFDVMSARALDLTWLVRSGTVQAALLTGTLGIRPRPVVGEVVLWATYLIPMLAFIYWPTKKKTVPVKEKAASVAA